MTVGPLGSSGGGGGLSGMVVGPGRGAGVRGSGFGCGRGPGGASESDIVRSSFGLFTQTMRRTP